MKSFKQHIHEGNIEHYGDKNDVNLFDGSDKSMQVIGGYLGSISEREFMNPDAAVHQIYNKLGAMGADFVVPSSEGQSGSHKVEVKQVPHYGKTGAEEADQVTEGEMNKFNMTIKYEQIPNGMYKVSASIN
jgi:hypothetical protein|tara:strand:+ start:819 stop:1211 length:393 start_codon:yes stop_codon:yes gene_type:complete